MVKKIVMLAAWLSRWAFGSGLQAYLQLTQHSKVAAQQLLLGDLPWELANQAGNVTLTTSIPSVALMSVVDHLNSSNPYWEYGELSYAWVATDTWTYTVEVSRDQWHQLSSPVTGGVAILQFDGIDTFAKITLNGRVIGSVADQFVRHEIVLTESAKRELWTRPVSHIAVEIAPALEAARRAAASHREVVPTMRYYNDWAEPAHRNFARKAPSDFGWDWGPAFVPAGISGAVSLIHACCGILSRVAVTQLYQQQQPGGQGGVDLLVDAYLCHLPASGASGHVSMTLRGPQRLGFGGQLAPSVVVASALVAVEPQVGDADSEGTRNVWARLSVAQPELWWPRGLGAQPLYTLRAVWRPNSVIVEAGAAVELEAVNFEPAEAGEEPDGPLVVTRRVGLRHFELVRERVEGGGESFFFRVNGVPVFSKGANWVPSDSFSTRVTAEQLRWLLEGAAAANMNTIRVWAGGPPQPDVFYDICDELGLLVWQELPYACSLYPADAPHLQSAAAQAEAIVGRLQTHSSVVIWGGNNEVEQSFAWFNESSRDAAGREHFKAEYEALFVGALRPAMLAGDPSGRPYLDSSPSNGADVVEGGGYRKRWGDPNDVKAGDMHFYAYDADCEDEALYPAARFVSEHGVQSMPSAAALAEAGAPLTPSSSSNTGDQNSSSSSEAAEEEEAARALLRHRQRHENGDAEMRAQMARHFGEERLPKYLAPLLHLTQVQQGRCLRTAVGTWRSLWDGAGSTLGGAGAGATSGVLYWQLNDVWQGPSWSTMEYGGRYKASHYAVARAFAPLLVSAAPARTNTVAEGKIPPLLVRVTSEEFATATGSVVATLYPWGSSACSPVREWRASFNFSGPGTLPVLQIPASDVLEALDSSAGAAATAGGAMLHVEAVDAGGRRSFAVSAICGGACGGSGGGSGSAASFWSGGLASAQLASPEVRVVSVSAMADGAIAVTIRATSLALHVWLDVEPYRGAFSDNDFALLPCRDETVVFRPRDGPLSAAVLAAALRVTSLADLLEPVAAPSG